MAAKVGVPDRLFKRHGRWKSEKAKDGYVDDSVERRLSVTRQLNLQYNVILDVQRSLCSPRVSGNIDKQYPTFGVAQPQCCKGGRGNSMVREMYFLSVECNELDRK